MLNKKNQINKKIYQCHSGQPTHVILNLIQDLNRDAECPQHDNRMCEGGRSMIEMLGVLAVIGVLTIIGIAGFKIAMNKAKANNLVADMNRLAHIVVMDKFSGYSEEAINRAVEEHNQKTEYQAEYEYRTPKVFAIKTVNPIDKEMCQNIANLGWKLPIAIYLNKTKIESNFETEDCTESNQLTWFFTNDLSACPDCSLGGFDCTPYANKECGSCDSILGYIPKDEDCNGNANGQYCLDAKCVPCEHDRFWWTSQSRCVDCYAYDFWSTQATYKHACLGTMFFGGGALWGCFHYGHSLNQTNVDEESCKKCTNRCYFATGDKSCQWTGNDKPYDRDKNGNCTCKYEENGKCLCPINQYWRKAADRCEACVDVNTWYWTTADYKHHCPGSMYYKNDGSLWGCSTTYAGHDEPGFEEESCVACPNRCYLDGACKLLGTTYTKDKDTGNCIPVQ